MAARSGLVSLREFVAVVGVLGRGTVYWCNVSMPFGRAALDDVLAGLKFAQQLDYPAPGAA